jgi:dihydrodipicolinate synthase/N-acetylneuraminate lyase
MANSKALARFHAGTVIPAHPLALTAERKLDERRQRALTRYYLDAGAGGIAVAVHTTQFAIREQGLLEPVLTLAREEMRVQDDVIAIAGICGPTKQAEREAAFARELGYDAGLLSLAALANANTRKMIEHVEAVAAILPVIGFYLQPAVGGRVLPYDFWRKFAEVANVIGIKMAPFNRYQTIDVIRAVADSGRDDITLYTGNDDNVVVDLLTPHVFNGRTLRIKGGLLGHWAVWTRRAVELQQQLHNATPTAELLQRAIAVTDSNAAFFDSANQFHGCIAGLHEVLRRQGLLEGLWCLDPNEGLSPGQMEEIDRVYKSYPELNDDAFVSENLFRWLK